MFGKVPEIIWQDTNFITISKTAKLLYLYLLTNKHRGILGVFRLPLAYIEADTKITSEEISKAIDELEKISYIEYDKELEVVLIKSYLKVNSHYSFKHYIGGLREIKGLNLSKLSDSLLEIVKGVIAIETNDNNLKELNNIVNYLESSKGHRRVIEESSKGHRLPVSYSYSKSYSYSQSIEGGEEKKEELNLFQEEEVEKVPSDKEEFQKLIDYLNELSGKRYRLTDQILVSMRARRKEGFTYEDMKKAIDKQVANLKGTDKEHYMHPRTIFRNASKLDGCINMTPKKKNSGRLGDLIISDTDPLNQ